MLEHEPLMSWQKPAASQTSRGHFVPSEIITSIVQYLPYDKHGKIQKQGLAYASLTCRYWARLLQPALFRDLTLQGPEDTTQALAFIESPSAGLHGKLTEYIQKITYCKTNNRIPPWARLYRLSKCVPQARLYFVVSTTTDEKADTISGSTLLHCLPRTLPSTAFPPLLRLELHHVEFATSEQLVRLVHTFPQLHECVFASLIFQSTSDPVRTITHRRCRAIVPAAKLEIDLRLQRPPTNFTAQLQLAFAVIDVKRSLSVPEGIWEIFEEAVTALVPSDVGVGDVRMDLTSLQRFSISAVGTGEAVRICFEVRVTKDSSLICKISHVRIDISKASDIPLTKEGWEHFEDALSKLRHTPLLEVVVGGNDSTLESVLQHSILARAAEQGKLLLRAVHPDELQSSVPASTREEVLSTPQEQQVDGHTMKLSAAERLELLGTRSGDKVHYLHHLKMSRSSDPSN